MTKLIKSPSINVNLNMSSVYSECGLTSSNTMMLGGVNTSCVSGGRISGDGNYGVVITLNN